MSKINFNEKQLEAINHYKGACAVIAGAGSGKSTVMTERVVTLINKYNVNPKDIVVLSFSDSAAKNMTNKLRKKDIEGVTSKTFHSLCKMILENENRDIDFLKIDGKTKEERKHKFPLLQHFKKYNKRITNGEYESVLKFIQYQRKYGIKPTDKFIEANVDVSKSDAKKYYELYEDFKNIHNLVDFEDLLMDTIDLIKNRLGKSKYTYKFLMVDEHQDSNFIQNELIKLLCPSENIFCVFDYRQAIYGFTGANPNYCMNFDKDFKNAKVINLDINYRSCNNIVKNANRFISNYYGDYEHYKDAVPNNKQDGYIKTITSYNKFDEAEKISEEIKSLINSGIKPKNIGVLYRTNLVGETIAKKLTEKNIDIDITTEGNFFNIKEVDIIINILRLITNTDDDEAMNQLFIYRVEGLTYMPKATREKINEIQGQYNLNLYQSLCNVKVQPWEKRNIEAFTKNIEKLKILIDRKISLKELIKNIYILFKIEEYIERNYESNKWEERKESLEALLKFAKGNDIKNFIKFAQGGDGNKKNKRGNMNSVQMRTVHGAKGLEWDYVFVVSIEDGKFPHRRSDLMEEARLFYVAVTRAKKSLYLSQIYEGNQFIEEYFGQAS